MQVLGTFQSRDVADAVRDSLADDGYDRAHMIVMSNREQPEPPEDAKLEAGAEGAGGFAGLEETIGKAALNLFGKKNRLEGDGFEGDAKGGAILGITVPDQAAADKVTALLQRHFASDIEYAQPD